MMKLHVNVMNVLLSVNVLLNIHHILLNVIDILLNIHHILLNVMNGLEPVLCVFLSEPYNDNSKLPAKVAIRNWAW
jgi:hypothetical protein